VRARKVEQQRCGNDEPRSTANKIPAQQIEQIPCDLNGDNDYGKPPGPKTPSEPAKTRCAECPRAKAAWVGPS